MEALTELAKGIGIAGVFIAIFLLVLANVQTQVSSAESYSENITLVNGTAVAVTYNIIGWTSLVNASDTSQTVPTSNYTVDTTTSPGTVTCIDATWGGNSTTATYTYYPLTAAYNATNDSIEAVAEIPGWFAIVIIVGIAVVLFLLLRQMSRAGGQM